MTPLQAASTAVLLAASYLAVGVGCAAWLALRGAGRLDPTAGHGTWGFRLLIVPGAALLWPVIAWRVARRGPAPPEAHDAHRDAAGRRARG
jgi:hypothetical protein